MLYRILGKRVPSGKAAPRPHAFRIVADVDQSSPHQRQEPSAGDRARPPFCARWKRKTQASAANVDKVTGKRVTLAYFPWNRDRDDGCIMRLIAIVDPDGKYKIERGRKF